MDSVISKANFIHDDAKKYEAFKDIATKWHDEPPSNCTVGDLSKALNALADKITEKKFPDFKTQGWNHAYAAFEHIIDKRSLLIIMEKIPRNSLHNECFAFVMRLFKFGPGTIHMRIIDKCMTDMDLPEYFQSLKGEKLQQLIQALTTDVKPREKVTEEEFYDVYSDFIRVVVQHVLCNTQLETHEETLMDFSMHLHLDFGHLNDRSCEALAKTGAGIHSALGEPWENSTNIARLMSYLKRCGNAWKNPNSLKSKMAQNIAINVMAKLSNTLGKQGKVEKCYKEVLDLAVDISKCSGRDDQFALQAFKSTVQFFSNIPATDVPKKPSFFQQAANKYCEVIEDLDLKFLASHRFPMILIEDFLQISYGKDKQSTKQWIGLMVPLLKKPCVNTMRACYAIVTEDKAVRWKEHPELASAVCNSIKTIKLPVSTDDGELKESPKKCAEELAHVISSFIEGLRKSQMLKDYRKSLLQAAISLMKQKDANLFELAGNIADEIKLDSKNDKPVVVAVMKEVQSIIQTHDYPWNKTPSLFRAVRLIIRCCTKPFKDAKTFTDAELKIFVDVCLNCLEHDAVHPEHRDRMSYFYDIFIDLMDSLGEWLKSRNKFALAAGLIPEMMKTFKEEQEQVTMVNCRYLITFTEAKSGLEALAQHLDKLIETYMDIREAELLRVIDAASSYNPKALDKHFQALFTILEKSGDMNVTMWVCQLFHKASKNQPQLFTEKNVELVIKKAKGDINNQPTCIQILQELSKRQPNVLVKHIDLLMNTAGWQPMFVWLMNDILCAVALYDKNVAPKVLTYLLKRTKSSRDKSNLSSSMYAIRIIGFKYPDLIKPRRAEIKDIKVMGPDFQMLKQHILDMIDGKTPEELRKQLESQYKNLTDLVNRVEGTEKAVSNVNSELKQQGSKMVNVKKDVKKQSQRLDQVEETVDETAQKIEEIDQKTLSHAPYWSRDVSKLLNPVSKHEWKLLASRLGYGNNDIRGWAQQADPCMAMLNEWYAVRKTSEATFAILTQLQEMNRMDAAIIVENAMKNAEAVVEDEDFEYASPPPVFISYQWGHQPEVKLLKQHLEMAGYDCWLDIGQMGGGDKLFEKIDSGIRAAKIVISCVTEKYAKSPNCNREVNLATSLNKGVIPLLLEKCTWPPPGSMGPIFSEYLFIRFYQRAGEELKDKRYWPKDKFQELLMQLNMFGLSPNDGKIDPIYRNWWTPMVEEIKIDKSKTKNGGQVSATKLKAIEEKAAVSPDVFISYQWGKQKNIIKLYERLTSLGLSCWLDIKQMGGGDSLYDKIDKGVRGSKVVISCVTTKYSLSANCRREVSLADALKRPLIPILLEKMTWPPAGPMSMVMTQLLYIDFTKDEKVQTTWQGPEFQQLLDKIYSHVPRSIAQESTGEKHSPKPASPSTSKAASNNQQKMTSSPVTQQEPTKSSPVKTSLATPQKAQATKSAPAQAQRTQQPSKSTTQPQKTQQQPKPAGHSQKAQQIKPAAARLQRAQQISSSITAQTRRESSKRVPTSNTTTSKSCSLN